MSELTCSKYIDFVNKSDSEFFYHENSNFVLFQTPFGIELMADSLEPIHRNTTCLGNVLRLLLEEG